MSRLEKIHGGRWAISREIGEEWVALIQETPVFEESDCTKVLSALQLSTRSIDTFFPRNRNGRRCPTFELMEQFFALTNVKGPTVGV